MVVGDAIGNGHLAFEHPDWPSGADQDAQRGASRRGSRLLDQAAADDMAMVGFHLPGGGLGRVARDGGAYRFVGEVWPMRNAFPDRPRPPRPAPRSPARISPTSIPARCSMTKPVEVIPGVWSAIGATAPPTYENAGHNNNLSFIVTGEGVVVINGGASYGLARALHDEIRAITDQPVKHVFNENGQGHAMLGNSYWVEQGVPIDRARGRAHEIEEYGGSVARGDETLSP